MATSAGLLPALASLQHSLENKNMAQQRMSEATKKRGRAGAERVAKKVAEVAGQPNLVRLDAEEAMRKVRAKPLQTELLAEQVEKTSLARTRDSRESEMARGHSRMRELHRTDAVAQGHRLAVQT